MLDDDGVITPDESRLRGRLKNSETLGNLESSLEHLSTARSAELSALIREYRCLFNDVPSRTRLIQHDIDVGDAQPICQRIYRVSEEKRQVMEHEIMIICLIITLLNLHLPVGLHPVYLSTKLLKVCTDYRKVNNVTKPDAYPLPQIEDCIDRVGSAHFVSKFDLLKGYWQVPLTPRAREISSFIIPFGLFSYSVMSFGLRNAPAMFQRLMNTLVAGLNGYAVYLDDVVCS